MLIGLRNASFLVAVHAAILTVWICHADGGNAEDRRAAEVEKRRFITVKFKEATMPSLTGKLTPKTLPAYVASISGVGEAKSSGMPALVYFYARKPKVIPKNIKKSDLKQSVKRCDQLNRKCFIGMNTDIGILAKLFVCVKVDIASVTPKKNRMFNLSQAPLVVIVPLGGGMPTRLSGAKLSKFSIASEMKSVLKRQKINVSEVLKKTKEILPRLSMLEGKKRSTTWGINKLQKELNTAALEKDGGASGASVAKCKKEQETLRAKDRELEKKLSAVHKEFDAALLGSRAAK